MSKLKAFADAILNVAKMTISLCDRVENTLGKGENAGLQQISISEPHLFCLVQLISIWTSLKFCHLVKS